jgi:hypothetical protein
MVWVGKITLSCPSGRIVRKLTGSGPGDVISRSTRFQQPGCAVEKIEIVKRGLGAGARDRYEGERIEGARARRAQWAPDPGADSHLITNAYRHVSSFGGARKRKRKKRR